jgi:DNA modification methylase
MIIARTENVTFHQGDSREVLKTIPDESFNTVVTSPPYWGLRDYGLPPAVWSGDATCVHEFGEETLHRNRFGLDNGISDKQKSNSGNAFEINQGSFCVRCGAWLGTLGLEPTPDLYVAHLVEIFEQVWRVLRDDGTAWLNLGDSYVGSMKGWSPNGHSYGGDKQKTNIGSMGLPPTKRVDGLKPKDLVGIPWRVAFALQAAGWYLRSDIIWHKPNPMPESVRDRPTKAHEYVFLLSKSPKYYYDADAVKEVGAGRERFGNTGRKQGINRDRNDGGRRDMEIVETRNRRTVWTIPTQPFAEAHFATFPEKLVEPCILAGAPKGGTVLDPFSGSGTVGLVATNLGRNAVLIDASMEYCLMAVRRVMSKSKEPAQ